MKRRKIILEDVEKRSQIKKAVGFTSDVALRYALTFKRDSPASRMARSMAMANGGILMEEVDNPDQSTIQIK